MNTITSPNPRLNRPNRPCRSRARRFATAAVPAAAALLLCAPALASAAPSPDPYTRFCTNNSDLCGQSPNSSASTPIAYDVLCANNVPLCGPSTGPRPPTSDAYNEFCANNSDLCTVIGRGVRNAPEVVYECTLNSGPNQCPVDVVIIGGYDYLI